MNSNRVPIDLLCIVLLYVVVGALLYVVPVSMLGPTDGNLDQGMFMDLFHQNALIVVGVSLMCMLTWYILGEWGIKAHAPASTWYVTWFLLFVIVLITAVVLCFFGPKADLLDPVNYNVAPFYLISGVVSFYLASVLFSPIHAKYLIWPARLIRIW